jgi:hypothetical protein
MKSFKFLLLAALLGCYVFGSAGALAADISVCPIGVGACQTKAMPASSYSNARAVDVTVHPVPSDPTGPSGVFCGRAAVYTDSMGVTERNPCQGHLVVYQAPTDVYVPAQEAYCDNAEVQTCYPATAGYSTTSYTFTGDCPVGFSLTTIGSSGPYQYYSCIKS